MEKKNRRQKKIVSLRIYIRKFHTWSVVFSRLWLKHAKKVAVILCCCGIWSGIWGFKTFNTIPNRTIGAKLNFGGYVDSAFCSFKINIGFNKDMDSAKRCNVIHLEHYNQRKGKFSYTMKEKKDYFLRDSIIKKYEDMYNLLPLDSLYSSYTIEYRCWSNVKEAKSKSSGLQNRGGTIAFMSEPIVKHNVPEDYIYGDGFVLFPNREGTCDFTFATSVDNHYPRFWSQWDISQTNMHLIFNSNSIKCSKIEINFNGSAHFSDMYPQPDIIKNNSIVFDTDHKISIIQKEGLNFHVEFIELKNLVTYRNFLLTAYLSFFISFLCSILFIKL